jgi:hypothetical protein
MKGQRKQYLFCLVLLVSFNFALAQRNLVEVPTSEIVEKNKLFFQQQAVVAKGEVTAATILTYGLGASLEVGLTLNQFVFKRSQGLEIDPGQPDEDPDLLINAQKGFDVKEWLKLGLGTRSGMNVAKHNEDIHFVNFSYFNSQFQIKQAHKVIAGVYYANDMYAGEGTNWGIMVGVDAELVKEKLNLIADVHSGNNDLSVANAGLQISLPKEWKITLGTQLAIPGSGNSNGAIIQVSKN